jgi:hypothetical protein
MRDFGVLAGAADTVPVGGHWHVGGFPAVNREASTVLDVFVATKNEAFASKLAQEGPHLP